MVVSAPSRGRIGAQHTPMRFTKLEGCGNDYIYVDLWDEPLAGVDVPALARAISDRHFGVGGDGLILVGPTPEADARMVVYNADGSSAEMCGNGLRCAGRLAWEHGRIGGNRHPRFATGAGILTLELTFTDTVCTGAIVAMGSPRLTPAAVPVQHPGPGPLLELHLEAGGKNWRLLAVGMGNPHAVCFVDDVATVDLARIGPLLEHHPVFPRRANIEFVSVLADERGIPVLRQRTWERGSGETLACGTGACAATVAAILDQRISGRQAIVRLNGGDVAIAWPANTAEVTMRGPATRVFAGEWR